MMLHAIQISDEKNHQKWGMLSMEDFGMHEHHGHFPLNMDQFITEPSLKTFMSNPNPWFRQN